MNKRINLELILKVVLFLGAISYILAFIIIAMSHLKYPYEIQSGFEDGILHMFQRATDGKDIYAKPSIEYTPFIYPPGYIYASSALNTIWGGEAKGFYALRLTSFLSTIGCIILIYLIVFHKTKNRYSAILGGSLFAACYEISGWYFEVARVDMLFILLFLLCTYLLGISDKRIIRIIAGIVLGMAFMTKQSALIIIIVLTIGLYIIERKKSLYFSLSAIVSSALFFIVVNYANNGWLGYYIFQLPSGHPFVRWYVLRFFAVDLLHEFLIPTILTVTFLGIAYYNNYIKKISPTTEYTTWKEEKLTIGHCIVLYFASILCSFSMRVHEGGALNSILPVYAISAVIVGIAYYHFIKLIQIKTLRNVLHMTVIIAFLSMLYYPLSELPTAEDYNAGQDIVEYIQNINESVKVLVPYQGYLVEMAGKGRMANFNAISDVIRSSKGDKAVKDELMLEIAEMIKSKKYDIIILDNTYPEDPFINLVRTYYNREFDFFENSSKTFMPFAGGYRTGVVYRKVEVI